MLRRYALSALFVVVVVACTGEDPDTIMDNGSSSGTPGGTDGGSEQNRLTDATVASDGASTSDSGGSDANSDAPVGNRSVVCDGVATCTGADKCCGVGIDWINASCKPDCGGAYELTCDDASDCGAGEVCCYVTDGGARARASFCAPSCRPAQNEKQLCASTAECPGDAVCTPLTMFSPNGLKHCN